METCTAQVVGQGPKLCHLKDKRSNLIRNFKVIHVRVTKDFKRDKKGIKGIKKREELREKEIIPRLISVGIFE